jgi:hypothetical protein
MPPASPVFISHASRNFRIADEVRARLEASDQSCWIAPRDIAPGASYGESIAQALEHCVAVVLILTEDANVSRAVANEIEMAFRLGKVIIPLRIKPVQPSSALAFFVNNAQWLDAWQTPLRTRIPEIVRIVTAIRSGSPTPAPSPEHKTFVGSLERQLEGWVRYKAVTLAVVATVLALCTAAALMMSGKTLTQVQREQTLIAQDPATFGLVNLAPATERANSNQTDLIATLYLNLREPQQAGVRWQAFWRAADEPPQAIDISRLQSFAAPGAQTLTLAVPQQARQVVICMTAMHPNLHKPRTAQWLFTIAGERDSVTVSRGAPPAFTDSAHSPCS